MEAFQNLYEQIGEEKMLAFCYQFMTFAVARPTEEQRVLLEQKFEQDRHFENLRGILQGSKAEPAPQAVPQVETATEIVETPLEATVEAAFEAPDEAKAARRAKAAILARAETNWPFMRVKNFLKAIRRYEGAYTYSRTLEKLGITGSRVSYMQGLEILAARKQMTLEQLLVTSPYSYFGDPTVSSRVLAGGNIGHY